MGNQLLRNQEIINHFLCLVTLAKNDVLAAIKKDLDVLKTILKEQEL